MDAKEPVSTKDVDFRITVIEEAVRLGRAGEPAHMAKLADGLRNNPYGG